MNRDQSPSRVDALLIELLQSNPTLLTSEAVKLARLMDAQNEETTSEQIPVAV